MRKLWDRLRRKDRTGPVGVQIKVRGLPRAGGTPGEQQRRVPKRIALALLLAGAFYVLAHISIVTGVWPVHGTAPGAAALFTRDAVALVAWLLLVPAFRYLGYRGSWAVVALPVVIFLLARPSLFQVFTDPVYQARGETRAEANALKAERSQISTILRTYDEERQAAVFGDDAPELPDPVDAVRAAGRPDRGGFARATSYLSVFLAPLALLLAFAATRRPRVLRAFREHRRTPFLVTLGIFFVLTLFFTELGKVRGTTPWELFLPVFIGVWAAVLAEDAYNLARPGQVASARRMAGLFLYGALPVVPFLVIRELGLSIVLAGSMAAMLLVGTRRGWWAALMLGVWAILVVAAFQLDERSATRLALAYEPYRDLSAMSAEAGERWAAKLHQIKLFDANILAGGILGEGAGRGHGETAPNAADDGYITLLAAQWGWAGALSIVLIYTLFLLQMFGVAMKERGAFERSLVTGLAMLIAIPFWLATLGGIRIIPLTGVAAAFAAHGGAKLLASAIGVGIIAGVSHLRGEAERLEEATPTAADATPERGIRIR